MKSQSSFLVGCLAGLLLSSMFYVWWSAPLASETLRTRLNTASPLHIFSSRQPDRPWSLASELGGRKTLLVAVLTSRVKLNDTAAMLNETWASWAEPGVDYGIFLGGDGPAAPGVHWLGAATDFQPAGGNLELIFDLLSYLHANLLHHYRWIMLSSGNTYIAARDLAGLLSRLDSSTSVYMGRSASEDKKEMAAFHLLPHEQFCEWGPGIILSRAALVAIAAHLDGCRSAAGELGQGTLAVYNLQRGDVELGRCFNRKMALSCTSSHEALSYFIHDTKGHSLSPERLWYDRKFQNLLTLYPVMDLQHMMAIHHFARVREFERLQQKLSIAENQTNESCRKVPPELAAPLTERAARSCRLTAFNNCDATASFSSDVLPPTFWASAKEEVNPWVLVNTVGLYQSGTTTPFLKVAGELETEMNYIIKKAIATINHREARDLVLWELIGCYLRYSGTQGREYILDMVLTGGDGGRERRRLRIIRPHTPDLMMVDDTGAEEMGTQVNILVPLSKVGDRYTKFLEIYEHAVLKTRENARLILIVFGDEMAAVKKSLAPYQKHYPQAEFLSVFGGQDFTRARALDLGMSQLQDSELAFLCDVDMTFHSSFLERCRLNTLRGKRVFYPDFFKYYNMDYVYRFKRKPLQFSIKRPHGHWADYSYGMLCIYKSDYEFSGGFDLTITGWGGEDVDLINRILKAGLGVLKVPEPDLSHRYHDKYCSIDLTAIQFAQCISSRNEGLADRMQLAEYVYYLEGQCGVREWSLWV